MSKEDIAKKIQRRFEYLHDKRGEPPSYPMKSSPEVVQRSLERYGVFVSEDIPEDLYDFNIEKITEEMYKFIYDTTSTTYDDPQFLSDLQRIKKKYTDLTLNETRLAALSERWNSAAGFGNSNFRFFYAQFTSEPVVFKIGKTPIEFTRCPIHRHNLQLLKRVSGSWELFKGMYPETNPMVSWDSQKIRFQASGSKSTASGMTIRHRDIYFYEGTELDRLQAMIILERPRKLPPISLGYVLFSNDPVIRDLIRQFFGKESHSFGNISDPLLDPIFDKMWRSTKNSFIVWNQSTIHYEAIAEDLPGFPYLRRLVSTDPKHPLYRTSLQEFNFRAVIGTHTPIGLSQEELKQLAYLSELGWIPEIYTSDRKRNKGTAVNSNIVNAKTTQWKTPRDLKTTEQELYEYISKEYPPKAWLPAYVPHEMYGVYEPRLLSLSRSHKISVQNVEKCIETTSLVTGFDPEVILDVLTT